MRMSAYDQHELDAAMGDELAAHADAIARRAARWSDLPEVLIEEPDDADELPEDCLDEDPDHCDACCVCDICDAEICVGTDGAAMRDDGYGGDMAVCADCQRQPDEPRGSTGRGHCLPGYDYDDGPI